MTLPAFIKTHSDLIFFAAALNRMAGPIEFFYQDGDGKWWQVWPRGSNNG